VVTNGNKYFVPQWDLLIAYHLDGYGVTSVTDSLLSGLGVEGDGNLTNLVNDGGSIELVDSGKRYLLPNAGRCNDWGVDCANMQVIKSMSSNFITRVPYAGPAPKAISSHGLVYKMESGTKEPFLDAQSFLETGFSWGQVIYVQDYTAVKPLGPLQMSHDTVLSFKPGAPILAYDSTNFTFHQVPSMNEFNAWGLGSKFVSAPASSFSQTPPALSTPLSVWAYDAQGKQYLVDSGRKVEVSAQASKLPTEVYNNFLPRLLGSLSVAAMGSAVQSPSAGVAVLEGGTRRHVARYSDFVNLGLSPGNTTQLSDYSAGLIPSGVTMLAGGSTFGASGGIFVVNGGAKLHVPTMGYFGLMNLDSSLYQAEPALAAGYPGSSELSTFFKAADGTAWSAHGERYLITPTNISTWGFQTAGWTTLAGPVANRMRPNRELGSLVIADNGGIYYGYGGFRHHVLSYGTFMQLAGGNSGIAVRVSDEFLGLSPAGSDLP
jgi:hypothetical protein